MIDLGNLRRLVDAAVRDVDPDRLVDVLGILEGGKVIVAARMVTPPTRAPIARLVTAEELAEAHAMPASWFTTAARKGTIPCVRFGSHVRFDAEAVRAALADKPPLTRRTSMGCPNRAKKVSNGKGAPRAATAAENRAEVSRG